MSNVNYHAWTHRPKAKGGTDPIEGFAIFAIKVFEDDITTTVGDGAFVFDIPEDCDGSQLTKCEAFVTTVTGSLTSIQIANNTQAVDMLSTALTIDGGDLNSMDANTPHVVNTANAVVAWGDEISIDIDAAGGMGLGVYLYFMAAANAAVVLQGAEGTPGAQGDPGGITAFTGQWQTATNYTAQQSVSNNGSSYAAIDNHTSGATTEPGVGVDWEDHWQLLAEASDVSVDAWTSDTATWTYASATTFTVTGDVTAQFGKGTRIRLNQTTDKYFVVTGSSFSAGTTTVTITGGTSYTFANAAVSAPSYSYAVSPQGYPQHFNYTPTWASSGTQPVLNNGTLGGRFQVFGGWVQVQFNFVAGSTTTFGTGLYTFSSPITESTSFGSIARTGIFFDSSTGAIYAIYWRDGSILNHVSPVAFYGATVPVTWAVSDQIQAGGTYPI